MSTNLAIRATIDQIEAARTRTLALYAEAFDAVERAHQSAAAAAPGSGMYELPILANRGGYAETDREKFLEGVRRSVDRSVWSHLIASTGLDAVMDKTARDDFRAQLEKDPPPATADNCHATIASLMGDADTIFKRGVATAFSKLDRRFRSHDGFKVGSRLVLSNCFSADGWWNHYARHDETLLDVERAVYLLDRQAPPMRDGGIVGAIKVAKGSSFGAKAFEAESDYFRAKVFKNGNVHLWFKEDRVVEQINDLLANYYGAALGAAPDVAAKNHEPNRTPAKNFGFFETPPDVVDRVLDEARLSLGLSVLEPSAGRGALAIPAARITRKVQCIEIQPENAEHIRRIGYPPVICADFLDQTPASLGLFDRVVMNPPFDAGRDVDHVTHAMRFLKPGGRLVSVMSAGVEFREDRKTADFRAMVERYGGHFRDLPPGSFKDSGTMVNTVIVSIPTPAQGAAQ